jgi:hypothetical protein
LEKSKVIEKLFSHIVTYSYLLIPLTLLFFKPKRKDVIPISLGVYAIVCFLLLQMFEVLPLNSRKYYFAIYTTFEYASFAFLFWKNITNKEFKSVIIVLSILFLLFESTYIFVASPKNLDSVPIGIETILILLFVFFFFYDFARKSGGVFIYHHHCFWLSVGILIYLGGSFFFYILFYHLTKEQINTFGNITYLAEIIKNLLFVAAIYIYIKNPVNKQTDTKESIPYLDMI